MERKRTFCPYCKEAIKADATICKHCHERLYHSREERVMAAILQRIQVAVGSPIAIPSVTSCGASCYARHAGNKARLNQCLDDCRAIEASAVVAERLHKELVLTFAEIVWGGGDIDPLPFEKAVRKSFSQPRKP